ncbi:MAG: YdiU family protein [Pseudomonadales bacterium]|nr:YdiU family protein [Pseudomonadales bacterium]
MPSTVYLNSLHDLHFDNQYTGRLPADPIAENYTRQVAGACYSFVEPLKTPSPNLISYSQDAANLLNLSSDTCDSSDFLQAFSGNCLLDKMNPYATRYGGHQFGNWAGQLGDGRAINLGEIINSSEQRWALQLKGSGPTPYSRRADGLAVLRSSVREFLCSEAMYHLGVPTTRALSLMTTGNQVVRDMFYDGNQKAEPGAVICRLAPSFTRFGHFQIHASRGETELLKQLIDFTIITDFPHLGAPSPETYISWFQEICDSTAEMVVQWMRVGFVHGVMNTDNMSILGLTIDYGPYGWLEDFDPGWTPNTTDAEGRRYSFGNQPEMAMWNLAQLGNALLPVIEDLEAVQLAYNSYQHTFQNSWREMMSQKLGFDALDVQTDPDLFDELLALLTSVETDMTIFFRNLARVELTNGKQFEDMDAVPAPLLDAYYQPEQLTDAYKKHLFQWLNLYSNRLEKNTSTNAQRQEKMNSVNPKYVLRNYLAQLAIDKSEQGDHSMVNELLMLFRKPYDEQPDKEEFAKKRPEWARHKAGCSMLSCSS